MLTRHHFLHQFKVCSNLKSQSAAKALHAQILKTGLHQHGPLPNALVDVYGKCGLVQDAFELFEEMPQRDHISWASTLAALNQADLSDRTLSIFPLMFSRDGLEPDDFVLATLVKACANLGDVRLGKQVHGNFLLSDYSGDDVIKSSLVDMYSKCGFPACAHEVFNSIRVKTSISWTAMISGYATSGRKDEALQLFQRSPFRNLYSWTALISGLVQSGKGYDAFSLFIAMRRERVDITDPFVFSSVVGACANVAALQLWKQVHGLVVALGFDSCLFVSNALVDMYAKCSDILGAKKIFCAMHSRDVVSWTSIIVGVAQHGLAEEALSLYDDMVSNAVRPNEVTFIGLIYACSHVGLVSKGRELFKSMVEKYRIRPSLQHYTCLLDLLSRSGLLEEAENLIHTMPHKPDEPTWAALLSACMHHRSTKMAVRIADCMLANMRPEDPSTYILLSNIYASVSKWQKVSEVRRNLASMEDKKYPGYSCIEVGKESQVFFAGEPGDPLKDEILRLLQGFDAEMRKRGYVPDTSQIYHDLEQQEKERQLFWHSERSAVAHGLLKAVPGTAIRVVKNLRVCGDCHTFMKYVSAITKREIIVRDANRYHHFKDGKCSCNNFW